jgi:hypothetical protein
MEHDILLFLSVMYAKISIGHHYLIISLYILGFYFCSKNLDGGYKPPTPPADKKTRKK